MFKNFFNQNGQNQETFDEIENIKIVQSKS